MLTKDNLKVIKILKPVEVNSDLFERQGQKSESDEKKENCILYLFNHKGQRQGQRTESEKILSELNSLKSEVIKVQQMWGKNDLSSQETVNETISMNPLIWNLLPVRQAHTILYPALVLLIL